MYQFAKIFRTAVISSAALIGLSACGGADSNADASETAASAPAEKVSNAAIGALADMAIGNPDATVTVIEYASLTCPHCATFHEDVYPEIKERYVDTGKVRFIFREFPTAPANLSVAGSMVARCAADKGGQDAYFLVLGSLFKTQKTWVLSDNPRDELLKVALQAGLSEEDFDACITRQELLDLINENVTEGREKYEINSTPSFVINGTRRNFSKTEDFAKALDEALEKAAE